MRYTAFFAVRRISIHPPREGWDFHLLVVDGVCDISIHPPREGWDSGRVSLSMQT